MSTRKSIAGTHYEEEDQSVRRSERIRRLSTDSNNTRAASPMLRMSARIKTNATESDDGHNTPTKSAGTPIRARRSSIIRNSTENLSNINPPLITTRRSMALSLEKLKTNSSETKLNNEEEIDNQLPVVNEEAEELLIEKNDSNVSSNDSAASNVKNKINKKVSGVVAKNQDDEMNYDSNKSENSVDYQNEQKIFVIEEEKQDDDMGRENANEKQNKKKLNESIKTPVSKSNHTPHTSTPYPFSAIKRISVTNKTIDSNAEKRNIISDTIKKSLSMSVDKESIEEESIMDDESTTNNSDIFSHNSIEDEKEKHENLQTSNNSNCSTLDSMNPNSVKGPKLSLSFGPPPSPSTRRSLNQSKTNTSNIKNTNVEETKQIDDDDEDDDDESPSKSVNKTHSKSLSMESKNITPVKGLKSTRMSLNNNKTNEPMELLTINDYKKLRAEILKKGTTHNLENMGNSEDEEIPCKFISFSSSSLSLKSTDDDTSDKITISESDESIKRNHSSNILKIDEQEITSMEIDNEGEKSGSTKNNDSTEKSYTKDSDDNEDDEGDDDDNDDGGDDADDDNEADEISVNKSLNRNTSNKLEKMEVDIPCTPNTDKITDLSQKNSKNNADSSNDYTDKNDDDVTKNNSSSLKKLEEKRKSINRKSLDKSALKMINFSNVDTSSDEDFDPNAVSTDEDDDDDDQTVKKGKKDLRLKKGDSDEDSDDSEEDTKKLKINAKHNTSKNLSIKSDKKSVNNKNTSKTMEIDNEMPSSSDDFDENAASSTDDDNDDDDDDDKDNEEIPMADDNIVKNNSISLKNREEKRTSTNRKSLDEMVSKHLNISDNDTSSDDDFDPDADSTDDDDDENDVDDEDDETANKSNVSKSNLSKNMKTSFEKKQQTDKSPIKKNIKKVNDIRDKNIAPTNEIETKLKSAKKQPLGQGLDIAEIMNRCQSFLEIKNEERSKLKSENQVKKQEKLDRIKRKNELKLIVRAKRMENEEKLRGEEILKKIQLKEKKIQKNTRKLAENEEKLKLEQNKIDEISESDEPPIEIKNTEMVVPNTLKHKEQPIKSIEAVKNKENKINVISKNDKTMQNLSKKMINPLNDDNKPSVVKQNPNLPPKVDESQNNPKLNKKLKKKNKTSNVELPTQKSTLIVSASQSQLTNGIPKVAFVKNINNISDNKQNQMKKQSEMTQDKIQPNEKKQKKNTEKKPEIVEDKIKPQGTVNVMNVNKKSNKGKQQTPSDQTKKKNEIHQGKPPSIMVSVASTSAVPASTSSGAVVAGTKRKIDTIIELEQKKQQDQAKSSLQLKKHKKLNIMELLESKGPKHLEKLSTNNNKVETKQMIKNANLEKEKNRENSSEISEVSKIYEYQKLINKSNIQKANDNLLKLSKKSKGIQKNKKTKKSSAIKEPQIVLPKPIFTASGQFIIQDFNPNNELHHVKNNPNIIVKPLTTKKSNSMDSSSIIPKSSVMSTDAFIPICKASSSSAQGNKKSTSATTTNQADFKYNSLFNNKSINRISSKELLRLKQKMNNRH